MKSTQHKACSWRSGVGTETDCEEKFLKPGEIQSTNLAGLLVLCFLYFPVDHHSATQWRSCTFCRFCLKIAMRKTEENHSKIIDNALSPYLKWALKSLWLMNIWKASFGAKLLKLQCTNWLASPGSQLDTESQDRTRLLEQNQHVHKLPTRCVCSWKHCCRTTITKVWCVSNQDTERKFITSTYFIFVYFGLCLLSQNRNAVHLTI